MKKTKNAKKRKKKHTKKNVKHNKIEQPWGKKIMKTTIPRHYLEAELGLPLELFRCLGGVGVNASQIPRPGSSNLVRDLRARWEKYVEK